MSRSRRVRRVLAGAAIVLAGACGGGATEPGFAPVERTVLLGDGLVQSVRVEMPRAFEQITLQVTSKVVNIGRSRVVVIANVCDLTITSDLTLTEAPGTVLCRGLPPQVDLAPGDSLVLRSARLVGEVGGRHTVHVQHLLDPSHSVAVPIQLPPGA